MAQPAQIACELLQFRVGIGRLVEISDDCLDELARQARDALILRLHARPGFKHKPRNVHEEAEPQHQCQQEIDARAQR